MPECAFCNRTAKLSGEHLWSEWMRNLFPGKKFNFVRRDDAGNIIAHWSLPGIDLTANVVCKPCNEGWMSSLESKLAKPAMADLIRGHHNIRISPERAQDVARFAFKTAVIVDHMGPNPPFFLKSVRRRFARSLSIPRNVVIWFGRYQPLGSGRFSGNYHAATPSASESIQLYVCTYAVGHLFFQVVAADLPRNFPSFTPYPESFKYLSIPLWPTLSSDFIWPPKSSLQRDDFETFAERWKKLRLLESQNPVTAI
jgi:hypothetical protein